MKGNLWIYPSRHTFRMGTKWTFPGMSNFATKKHSSHPIPLHPTQSHHWCFNVETYCIYFWYRNNDEPKKLPGVDGRGLGWQRWDPSHSNPTPIPPGPIVQNCRIALYSNRISQLVLIFKCVFWIIIPLYYIILLNCPIIIRLNQNVISNRVSTKLFPLN